VSTKHLDELACGEQVARHAPLVAERRNEADEDDQAGIHHQLRHLGNAPDVFHPVRLGEAQVAIQAMANVVAVEQIGVLAVGVQALLQQIGDGRFARPRQPGEPDALGLLVLLRGARAALFNSSACQWILLARRRAKSIMPAPTVSKLSLSIRMKPPSLRLTP
jgi:hypothetical protein